MGATTTAASKKIIITFVQSQKIHRLLKADTGEMPLQEFIDLIAKESEIPQWQAEKFASAWRWNHRNDYETGQVNDDKEEAKPKQPKKPETYYVQTPLPQRSTAAQSDPSLGTGKVAQIIALAEQGKSTQEIIGLGYNKSTVYRQYSEWKKRKSASKSMATA